MITWVTDLLKKAVLKRATTHSVAEAYNIAERQHTWALYILKVLQATPDRRAQVLAAAIADNQTGTRQLAGVITMFNFLNDNEKVVYIRNFKAAASLHGGVFEVASQGAWQPHQIPPVYEP